MLARSPELLRFLQDLIKTSRFSREFLEFAADRLGWAATRKIIADKMPTQPKITMGDFGEALSVAILVEFERYAIPVQKLRYKITNNQTQPSTDALGFRVEGDNIVEACFVESKLRTVPDTGAPAQAYKQLNDDYMKDLPDILVFVAQRLFEMNNPLADTFMRYLRDREDRDFDTFTVSLVYDKNHWNDASLDNIEELQVPLGKVSVQIVHVNELRALVKALYEELGLSCNGDE